MPIFYDIDRKLGIIRERWTGSVTAEDVKLLWTRYLADPEILALRATLADLREATLEFGGAQLRRLVQTVVDPQVQGRDWISAIIVAGPVQLDISRQYQDLADHYSRDAIFFDEHDALEWLLRQRATPHGMGRWAPWGDRRGDGSTEH
jgi:hypothetical protein